tara:strand:- start:46279 stop:47199 length:921 start_codon:yes stop_codon:yes gene_type:complete
MTGVLRPGHVQLRVLDLDESIKFYGDVLGLIETGRDQHGRVYFKCWDEHDHSSFIIREAEAPGMDYMGFRVLDVPTLNDIEKKLNDYGLETTRIPAGELLETGERVRFTTPSGHEIEFYAEKNKVGNGLGNVSPAPWAPEREKGMGPVHLDHCLLYGPNIDETAKIFTELLGFRVTENILDPEGGNAAHFMSTSHKPHDIAFVNYPEPGKFHHASFLLETWEQVLRAADIMSMHKVNVDIGPTRHGVTRGMTIYAWDPSGNRFETFAGGYFAYPDKEKIVWPAEDFGQGLDYPQRKLHESFLTIVT